MSSQLTAELAHYRELEVAAHARRAHRRPELLDKTDRPRRRPSIRGHRVAIALALGLSIGGGTATISAAAGATGGPAAHAAGAVGASSRSTISYRQFAREIRTLQAKGYRQTSCTVGGTTMYSPRTHRTVLVAA